MTVLQFYATVLIVTLAWIIGTFFWLRLVAAALFLAVWGVGAFILPLALALNYIGEGRILGAVAVVLVAVIPAYLFVMTSRFAMRWLERERERGGFARPLFARD